MRSITAYGPSVFLDQAEMATIPVPHQHLPSRGLTNHTTKHAMTSISPDVPDLSADSHINSVTTSESAINSSLREHPHWLQLQESTFRPVTLVQVDRLKQLLQGHPNRKLVQKVVHGFQFGFPLKDNGPRVNIQPHNLRTAFTHSHQLWKSVMKKVSLGCMLSPFEVQPICPLICSPVGMVEKNFTAVHHITHLSHPQSSSINSFIAPENAETHYQTFKAAVQLVAHQGKGAYMAKEDFKSAFRNVPMRYQDLNLLGIKVQGKFFIDCVLPFGASIFCAIFEDISTLIHWIAERRAAQKFIHYLDFFIVHKYAQVCGQTMGVLKQVCQEIQMPIAPEKSEGPATVVELLGLTLDTEHIIIHISEDKLQDIAGIIAMMIKASKSTSWELQSLAGKLNFFAKAVPVGKSFIK